MAPRYKVSLTKEERENLEAISTKGSLLADPGAEAAGKDDCFHVYHQLLLTADCLSAYENVQAGAGYSQMFYLAARNCSSPNIMPIAAGPLSKFRTKPLSGKYGKNKLSNK